MSDPDQIEAPAETASRRDLDSSLRFVHALGMLSRDELIHVGSRLEAIIHLLAESGLVQRDVVDQVAGRVADERRQQEQHDGIVVRVANVPDKYALRDLPDIDCEALMPLCQGRCCSFLFHLSFQDLDEGAVRWDYERPYQIRTEADGRCTHQLPKGRCEVYHQRPATCRGYDCRQDPRVWLDFARKIPAPLPPQVIPLDALRRPRAAPR